MIAGTESLWATDCAQIWTEESGRPVQAGFTGDVDWDVLTSNRLSGKKAHDFRNVHLALRRRGVAGDGRADQADHRNCWDAAHGAIATTLPRS